MRLAYNWSYPLTIGRATCRMTLQQNTRLRTTWADWLHDLRRLEHDPTGSSVIVRSCDWLQQVAKPFAVCDQNLVSDKHSRSVACTSNRRKSHDQKIVRSGLTIALYVRQGSPPSNNFSILKFTQSVHVSNLPTRALMVCDILHSWVWCLLYMYMVQLTPNLVHVHDVR